MTTSDFPLVRRIVTSCYPAGYENECLDADLRVNTRMAELCDAGLLKEAFDELTSAADIFDTEHGARLLLEPMMEGAEPRDGSYLATLLGLADIAEAGCEDPSRLARLADEDDRPRTFRASRFLDLDTANTAATEVLRHNAAEMRGWHEQEASHARQHYYADLGRPVGIVKDTRREFSGQVTGAVVILQRDADSQHVYLYESYPELPLDETVRRRYPDLPHLFGAYFGDVPEAPWPAQEDFHWRCGSGTRERVATQLNALETLGDDEMRLAVEAFGSHVLPHQVREWVEVMRFRMEAGARVGTSG